MDRWEEQQAARDEDAHSQTETAPQVQVALDNQARFLNWVAKGAQPAADTTAKDGPASSVPSGKPHASLEVTAESVRFLGGKNGNGAAGVGLGESEMDIDESEVPF